jgi:hypothetical protein
VLLRLILMLQVCLQARLPRPPLLPTDFRRLQQGPVAQVPRQLPLQLIAVLLPAALLCSSTCTHKSGCLVFEPMHSNR